MNGTFVSFFFFSHKFYFSSGHKSINATGKRALEFYFYFHILVFVHDLPPVNYDAKTLLPKQSSSSLLMMTRRLLHDHP